MPSWSLGISHCLLTRTMSCSKEVAWVRTVLRFARMFCSLVSSSCSLFASVCRSFSRSSSCSFSLLVQNKTARSLPATPPNPLRSLGQAPPLPCAPPFPCSLSKSQASTPDSPSPKALGKGIPSRLICSHPVLAHLRVWLSFCRFWKFCSSWDSRRRSCSASSVPFFCWRHFSVSMRIICSSGRGHRPIVGPLPTSSSFLKIQLGTCSHVQASRHHLCTTARQEMGSTQLWGKQTPELGSASQCGKSGTSLQTIPTHDSVLA